MLALVNIFICLAHTVLDIPRLQKSILISMDQFEDFTLESISQNFVISFRQMFSRDMGLKSLGDSRERILGIRVIKESLIL
jgi:hypothetical protein